MPMIALSGKWCHFILTHETETQATFSNFPKSQSVNGVFGIELGFVSFQNPVRFLMLTGSCSS